MLLVPFLGVALDYCKKTTGTTQSIETCIPELTYKLIGYIMAEAGEQAQLKLCSTVPKKCNTLKDFKACLKCLRSDQCLGENGANHNLNSERDPDFSLLNVAQRILDRTESPTSTCSNKIATQAVPLTVANRDSAFKQNPASQRKVNWLWHAGVWHVVEKFANGVPLTWVKVDGVWIPPKPKKAAVKERKLSFLRGNPQGSSQGGTRRSSSPGSTPQRSSTNTSRSFRGPTSVSLGRNSDSANVPSSTSTGTSSSAISQARQFLHRPHSRNPLQAEISEIVSRNGIPTATPVSTGPAVPGTPQHFSHYNLNNVRNLNQNPMLDRMLIFLALLWIAVLLNTFMSSKNGTAK